MDIKYVYPFGERCNSALFLNKYNLRKMAYPLDWNRIDFESCCHNISNNFDNFLNDIVVFKENDIKLYYPKNSNSISNKLLTFFKYKNKFGWNNRNYNHVTFRINQNFLPDKIEDNIYNWNRLCFLWNYDITDQNIYNKIKERIVRFNNIYKQFSKNILFLHISKIINNNYEKEINYYENNILKYNLYNSFFCIVLCCGYIEKSTFINKKNILFIILKVPSEEIQKKMNDSIVNQKLYHANDIYNNLNDFVHPDFYEIDHKYIYDVLNKFYIFNLNNIYVDPKELEH
tara:strand:- start:2367 stop:3227 length:861 start_codon:yes stop_codon:yes gene_type:complete